MSKSIKQLRRDAKALRRAYEAGEADARQRMASILTSGTRELKHNDFLHAVAREQGFASWPRLVFAVEALGYDRATKVQRLKQALAHGQNWRVDQLLADTPDLAEVDLGIMCALYNLDAVQKVLWEDPKAAVERIGPRTPILHLAFSKYIHARPELQDDMLAVADLLVAKGADVNDGYPAHAGSEHLLSALYGAIGHANNMPLGRWLLEHGANPNDNESLYHATELGHHEGLKMLLDHGAEPAGTNALLRAMDFNDATAVRMLLQAGAQAGEFNDDLIGGEGAWVQPALHQAARRMCSDEIVQLILESGADAKASFEGLTPYAAARIYGNQALARALEVQGDATPLNPQEKMLAQIADKETTEGFIDPAKLPESLRNTIRHILHLPGKLPHVQRLIAAGMEYDRPDGEGLTPVQVAGWEGLPEVLNYFLSLKPDLSHVNGYGGTLLSTIIHGSENNPSRKGRDYIECLTLVLTEGVALPRQAIEFAGEPEIAAFLADWGEDHPGQVVEHGIG